MRTQCLGDGLCPSSTWKMPAQIGAQERGTRQVMPRRAQSEGLEPKARRHVRCLPFRPFGLETRDGLAEVMQARKCGDPSWHGFRD